MTEQVDDDLPIEMDNGEMPELIETDPTKMTKMAKVIGMKQEAQFQQVSRKRKRQLMRDTEMTEESTETSTVTATSAEIRRTEMTEENNKTSTITATSAEIRRVSVPPHRYSPLKENWRRLIDPITKQLHLRIRFNVKRRQVELQSSEQSSTGYLQKGEDFIRAFVLGFEVDDALALIRLDDLFIESFEINDVKPLKGEHLSRAIGRVAGKDGRTRLAIENATRTRIVLADSKIHLLGSFQNIAIARHAVCSLILGSPPSKIYGNLRSLASRTSERM